jgi:hypothetical protein
MILSERASVDASRKGKNRRVSRAHDMNFRENVAQHENFRSLSLDAECLRSRDVAQQASEREQPMASSYFPPMRSRMDAEFFTSTTSSSSSFGGHELCRKINNLCVHRRQIHVLPLTMMK